MLRYKFLGQVAVELLGDDFRLLIDPYFSNSVEEKEDPSIKRLVEIPYSPESLDDIDYILITHAHRDHCDPETLLPIAAASPGCQFCGPAPVIAILNKLGIASERLVFVQEKEFQLGNIVVQPVPSAHPSVKSDSRGGWQAIGYVLSFEGTTLYHPGDTGVSTDVIKALESFGKIDIGFIPVNEQNYYREQENIIGNMSLREAFAFADDINLQTMVPTHWDMFSKNEVYVEEIELLYSKVRPRCHLDILFACEERSIALST